MPHRLQRPRGDSFPRLPLPRHSPHPVHEYPHIIPPPTVVPFLKRRRSARRRGSAPSPDAGMRPLSAQRCGAPLGGFGAPGALGAPGAGAAPAGAGAEGAPADSSVWQNGHFFRGTPPIDWSFLPQLGHSAAPALASAGLKHMLVSFPSGRRAQGGRPGLLSVSRFDAGYPPSPASSASCAHSRAWASA